MSGPDEPAAGDAPIQRVSPTASSVHAQIRWDQVHGGLTRYQATATSFAWPAKVLLGAPPWLALAWWAWIGVFNHPLFALMFAVPMTWAGIWWTRQVWGRHRTTEPTRGLTPPIGPSDDPDRPNQRPHLTLGAGPPTRDQ